MSDLPKLTFGITPFYVTRQYYYALERGFVGPDGLDVQVEYYHSPAKDQVLICGKVDASTISIGKYLLAKTISDTYTLPTDPFAVASGLTYENGNGLFVRSDSEIEEPADLAGKRLGIHDKSIALASHMGILEDRYHVPIEEVEWVFDTHQQLTTRMENGDLDGVERVGDWYWNLRTSPDYRMLYDMAEQWHELQGYYPMVHLVAVDKAIYDERPAVIDAFVTALKASRDYRDEHYEEIMTAFVEEEDARTEWTGRRTVEELTHISGKSSITFTLDETQKRNVRDVMEYMIRYGIMDAPIEEERLYPA